jgi:hypothetical protein
MTKRVLGTIFVLFLFAGSAGSGVHVKSIHFENPVITSAAHGMVIEVRGCRGIAHPGEPIIPVYPACFLLPPGEAVQSVTVEADEKVVLPGSYEIAPMPASVPPGRPAAPRAARNPRVYDSSSPYLASNGALATEQILGGMHLAFINIYPCDVIPSSGTIIFSPSVTVTIETRPVTGSGRRIKPSRISKALGKIERLIENPGLTEQYRVPDRGAVFRSGQTTTYPYVIITGAGLSDSFQYLAGLKTTQGLRAKVVDLDSISTGYPGNDIQEKIRNFIAYAYENWETDYVLLGGDEEIIPHRGLYVKVGTEIEPDIPSDLYYAALDGDWNSDGDAYFGEPGEEDLLPEVTIGRLPVDSPLELSNFISKLEKYTLSPPDSVLTRALMLGELLWSDDGVDTWGGDYKDEIAYGSSNFGFTTAGVSPWFDITILYDRDLGYPWNVGHLAPLINDGAHLINHLGHASLHSVMRMSIYDVQLLENDAPGDLPFICYSQGCYAASFDNRDDAGTFFEEDAISEALLTDSAGAVAFIGNTRLGWNAPGSTCGVSQFFDRQFFDAVFGEGITTIGRAFDDSRIDNIPFVSYAAIRYVMYGLCLLGDPAMDIWTDEPGQLEVIHDSLVAIGQEAFTALVQSGGAPVEGARVAVSSEELGIYSSALTDFTGSAILDLSLSEPGELLLSIQARNHHLFTGALDIVHSTTALPKVISVNISDDSLGWSRGDGDQVIENGEIVELGIIIKNLGTATAKETKADCVCTNEFISFLVSQCDIGDLPPRTTVIKERAFVFRVDSEIPDGNCIDLCFQISSLEGQWNDPHPVTVDAPDIFLESWSVTDTMCGDGDGCLENWETHTVQCTWRNNGGTNVVVPTVTLSFPDGSYAKANKYLVRLPSLPAGGELVITDELAYYLKDITPPFYNVTFFLKLDGHNIPAQTETLTVMTCGYEINDPVDTEWPWHHTSAMGIDAWHMSGEQYYSAPSSWKCGNDSEGAYANMVDAVLVSPPLCLYENSTLSFMHRIEAEASPFYPYWAQDAGVVEISTDGGGTWQIISPSGNYPVRASASNTIFLDPYQRCYSGYFEWTSAQFDLSAFHGPVLIRFHFASDEQYGFEGWYIDDIEIQTEQTTDVDDDTPRPHFVNAMMSAHPNPFNPSTTIPYEVAQRSRVEVKIFDVAGRHVQTLVDQIKDQGRYVALWHGRDRRGAAASSGVYFCRLTIGSYSATQRLIMIR